MPVLRNSIRFAVAAGVTATILTAAGCSSNRTAGASVSSSSGSATSASAVRPSTPVASSSTTASVAVPTGKQLAALFGAATPPNGYAPQSDGATDSGAAVLIHPGAYVELTDCKHLTTASNHDLTADYESSEAEIGLQKDGTNVSVLVAAYAPGDVDKQWLELTSLFTKCPTYDATFLQTNPQGGSQVTMTVTMKTTVTPVAALGDQALDVRIYAAKEGFTSRRVLLVRTGDRIISMEPNAQQAATFDLQPFAQAYIGALTK